MKKLSDYTGDRAIELWGDLLEPAAIILADPATQEALKEKNVAKIASKILKAHPKEINEILLLIDDTPITALNVVSRVIALVNDVMNSDEAKSFFGFAETKEGNASIGSVSVNIEGDEK